MTKIESGKERIGSIPQESAQKDVDIVRAVDIAINEHNCSQWTKEQRRILEEGEYGLLSEVEDIFGSFHSLRTEIVIRALQERRAPDPLIDDLNIDIFAPMKKDLRAKGVPATSLSLVGKVFREALHFLDTGWTINELRRESESAQRKMASRVLVPQSVRRSERSAQNPFNRNREPLRGLAVKIYGGK